MVEAKATNSERPVSSLERGSQAVHRVLRILLCWKEQNSTLSLTEIAQRTGLTLPTAHRMIKALQREGFLVHDKISGNYALGPTILDLARVVLHRSDQDELVVTAIPHLERMREITGETVGLHIPMGDLRMCLAELVSRRTIRTATGVGRTFPLPGGASGQVLTAWCAERLEKIDSQIESAEAKRELRDRLAQVCENNFAVSIGETIPGASELAFPLFGPDKDVRAAVNITGPDQRWTREAMMSHVPRLTEEINCISEQLGYRP